MQPCRRIGLRSTRRDFISLQLVVERVRALMMFRLKETLDLHALPGLDRGMTPGKNLQGTASVFQTESRIVISAPRRRLLYVGSCTSRIDRLPIKILRPLKAGENCACVLSDAETE